MRRRGVLLFTKLCCEKCIAREVHSLIPSGIMENAINALISQFAP
jgi:hypothetical protein